ncbi:divalent-cation tolerance protein CutA [Isoptericola variabilis]|uniref:CutA1 divalent ion tolerance protein n=1 Tax=Isoptericola variabilis (strain 225) TaxID=743718 RepID=F6FRG0_ISOV2|nr:divalent-cation tolerance protein CutA [Isoptericola variabilis]AEG43921.1 CutA1 divalent ion tolerance protein [Isoptericola variabilis 225]TWH30510.1 divalent cation tolerance protein [Isoptericola variabilis J7]
MTDLVQVVTVVDSDDVANALVRDAVAARLAACGQVDGPLTSTYWWEGQVETATEWRATLKTTAERAAALEAFLVGQHPYDVPEVLTTPVTGGNPDYLRWVAGEVR